MTAIVRAVLGTILLLTGRKLYWLFVGVIGFVVGLYLSILLFKSESELLILVIALTAGVLGAVLALYVQRLAVSMAGFIAGGYLLTTLFSRLSFNVLMSSWLLFLVGGIIGVLLVLILFDWALIVLSALMGASLLIDAIHFGQWATIVLWVVLFSAGILIQARTIRHR